MTSDLSNWDKISQSLDKIPVSQPSLFSKLVSGKWLFISTGATLSICTLIAYFMTSKPSENPVLAKNVSTVIIDSNKKISENKPKVVVAKNYKPSPKASPQQNENIKFKEQNVVETTIETSVQAQDQFTSVETQNVNEITKTYTEPATPSSTAPKTFYDKMIQSKKDSTKPLFTPKK
jgi:hypothetical protein